jgi:broad specificity phosphatase PhoE
VRYLLRHGETEWNRVSRKQGRGDSPLTSLGVRQVEAYARLLAQETSGCARVQLVTSPLGRARASAEIIRVSGSHARVVIASLVRQ